STGTLSCTPGQTQIDACTGKAAGDACTLTRGDSGVTDAGTCRATLDGKSVACVPNPPAPPQPAVDACTGKASGDACTVAEREGSSSGTCAVDSSLGATICVVGCEAFRAGGGCGGGPGGGHGGPGGGPPHH